eukprot:6722807-Pyramimonas_sp.AAC.1
MGLHKASDTKGFLKRVTRETGGRSTIFPNLAQTGESDQEGADKSDPPPDAGSNLHTPMPRTTTW